jgi:hypothetical protein
MLARRKTGLKRLRGYDFHTLEVLFAGMVSGVQKDAKK